MKLQPDKIPEGDSALKGSLPAEVLDIQDDLVRQDAPIAYDLTIFKHEALIEIRGATQTKVQVRCGRCGDWMPWEVESKNFELLVDAPFPESIDLTSPLREDILLGLPFAPACVLDPENRCPLSGEIPGKPPERKMESLGAWQVLENWKEKKE